MQSSRFAKTLSRVEVGTVSSVRMNEVSKWYGETVVVDSLNLEIHGGEFVTLLGPSGCGKTTVLRMIAGLDSPSKGMIQFGSQAVFDSNLGIDVPPERRGLGMVFQSYAVWPHMNVIDNASFGLRCQGIRKMERNEIAMQWLKRVKMDQLATRMPSQLSGGQQQRVALARALASGPKILLMDEPLSNLDANLRSDLVAELKSLKKEVKTTVIYVTHDHEEAKQLSDRTALMNLGRIEQYDQFSEILRNPGSPFVKSFLRLA